MPVEDESGRSPTHRGEDWFTYKKLVLHLLEEAEKDIREIKATVASHELQIKAIHEAHDQLRERITALEKPDLQTTVTTEQAPVIVKPVFWGLVADVWKHPIGKLLCLLIALTLAMVAATAYNVVSDRQIDLDRRIPGGESPNPPSSRAP